MAEIDSAVESADAGLLGLQGQHGIARRRRLECLIDLPTRQFATSLEFTQARIVPPRTQHLLSSRCQVHCETCSRAPNGAVAKRTVEGMAVETRFGTEFHAKK